MGLLMLLFLLRVLRELRGKKVFRFNPDYPLEI
jgi:hypothetical protein